MQGLSSFIVEKIQKITKLQISILHYDKKKYNNIVKQPIDILTNEMHGRYNSSGE